MRRRMRDTADLRWLTARAWTTKWYPQGIDVGSWRGGRTLAVSWFRQDKTGTHLASRVVLIDPERSRHIDVALAVTDDDGELQPAQIHTGGLAWFEDRLFVAATGQGIWEFDLGDTRQVRGAVARRLRGVSSRWRPATALVAVRSKVHPIALRCSFLGRAFDDDGTPLRRVLIGEYRRDDQGRIAEFSIPEGPEDSFEEHAGFAPGIARMQGVVRWGALHFVSQSNLMKPGRLWSGPRDDLTTHSYPLPVGCEDLALDPEAEMLWSLGEHPRQRVVRGIPFTLIGLGRGRQEARLD
jgi:hypothetical protein